ncbi:MAG: hypothetical protein AAF542_25540 [Pseudomonadota bacterium]
MTKIKLLDWVQVGGNIAILIGLVFVAIQLYQDRQLKSIEMSAAQLDKALQLRLALIGEESFRVLNKSMIEDVQLTREEALVLTQIYSAELLLYEQTLFMQRSGLWPKYDVGIPISMATDPGQRWLYANFETLPLSSSTKNIWKKALDTGTYDHMLRDIVDSVRSDEAAESLRERVRRFRERVRDSSSES